MLEGGSQHFGERLNGVRPIAADDVGPFPDSGFDEVAGMVEGPAKAS